MYAMLCYVPTHYVNCGNFFVLNFRDYFNRTETNRLYYDYVFKNKTLIADQKVMDVINFLK